MVSEVTSATTRSPGRAWRTNTTRPSSARATHPPPAAMAPVTTSILAGDPGRRAGRPGPTTLGSFG